jgi:hypothetical protein
MGRDKGYGSGKPLSANDSRTRTRVAANRFTKGKKNPIDNLVSKSKTKAPKQPKKRA